ncbi:hypothetical protein JMJ58_17615 [Haloterrigena salifodinae]|uniref:DUF7305 domain-containing protein n=2 Tax=Haloterrigena salifodinae TaxID=2675099 RepID=A0A8T8E794_9EURY|nr:hypothetical protein JMJ58_17615 [Haloterrigena salifodinae]
MVAAGSLGIFLIAGDAITGAEQQSEQERIEQAFVELSNSISSSAGSGDVSQSMELHAGDQGAIAHHDSATYKIWTQSYNGTNSNVVADGSIGTIEYEDADGTKIAYEGGAVFRETGRQTRVLSSPPIDYNHETSTLSFPVFGLTEDKTIDSGDISIKQTGVDREPTNYIQNDHVFVEIQSKYCRGWQQYFTEQAGDTTLQESCYGGENEDGTVKVRLGYDDIANAFSSGVAVPSEDNIDDKKDTFDDISAGKQYQPMDGTILQLTDNFENGSAERIDDTGTYSAGNYYADELTNPDLDFDLSDGDAILAVDGDVRIDSGGISVTNCRGGEGQLKIYVEGDFSMSKGAVEPSCGGAGDVETIQVYGMSTTGINFHSNPTFNGLIYAASDKDPADDGFDGWPVEGTSHRDDNYQVNFQGANEFKGALVVNSINVDSKLKGVDDVTPDDDAVIEPIPDGYAPVPQLTYLNLAEYRIEIKNN